MHHDVSPWKQEELGEAQAGGAVLIAGIQRDWWARQVACEQSDPNSYSGPTAKLVHAVNSQ